MRPGVVRWMEVTSGCDNYDYDGELFTSFYDSIYTNKSAVLLLCAAIAAYSEVLNAMLLQNMEA